MMLPLYVEQNVKKKKLELEKATLHCRRLHSRCPHHIFFTTRSSLSTQYWGRGGGSCVVVPRRCAHLVEGHTDVGENSF